MLIHYMFHALVLHILCNALCNALYLEMINQTNLRVYQSVDIIYLILPIYTH